MSKIALILKREYITRVRKKSFIIMTILGPILFGALLIAPVWIAQLEDTEEKLIAVIDSSKLFVEKIPETQYLKFEYLENTLPDDLKMNFDESGYYALLYISHTVASVPSAVQLMATKQPNMSVVMHITNAIEKEIEQLKMKTYNIDNLDDILTAIKTNIKIQTIKWTPEGEEKKSSTELSMIVGYVSGFLIYFFIFMFGAQVMRGVIEEKSNRIVEVIVSSVKPFQLMMGKITGIALVGLTQFALWIILTLIIYTIASATVIKPEMLEQQQVQIETLSSTSGLAQAQPIINENLEQFTDIFSHISAINFPLLIVSFIIFFLGGYLLYASLFAAVGSAVDNEADTQQFMLPITIPLVLAIIVMLSAIENPEGPIAFWFSMIPFTSPIIMMVRIAFHVPQWEVILSMIILILTFIGTTWMAGKIYKTGILMYGKKVSYKEIWKWLKYSG